jgi:hypothetical protein
VALTITAAGTVGTTGGSATAISVTLTQAAPVGSWVVFVIAQDNGGGGGASTVMTPTDSEGNTWTQRRLQNYNPVTTPDTGITQAFFTSQITAAMSIGDTITAHSAGGDAIAAAAWVVTPGVGNLVEFASAGGDPGSNTQTPTTTTGTLAAGELVVAALCAETSNAITSENDTSNGSWSTAQQVQGNTSGTNIANVRLSSQAKVVTGSGTQTYNPTLPSPRDLVIGWIVLRETAPAGTAATIWNGSAWVPAEVEVWDGAAWQPADISLWDGAAWN